MEAVVDQKLAYLAKKKIGGSSWPKMAYLAKKKWKQYLTKKWLT